MLYVVNAFSINMLKHDCHVEFEKIDKGQAASIVSKDHVPAIGHKDTAEVVSSELKYDKSLFNRSNVSVNEGDCLLIAQYIGARLPEGAKTLPAGATIEYWLVRIL